MGLSRKWVKLFKNMALFNKQHLKAIVLIEKQLPENKFQSIATGFLIGFATNKEEADLSKKLYRIFLLTNRHVFSGQQQLWVRFDKKDSQNTMRFPIQLRVGEEIKWLAHKDEKVDLAMLTINPDFLNSNGVDWSFINEETFAYPEKFNDIGIELGDDIFLAGFPLGIAGNERNYAIVRSGSIARVDQEIINSLKSFLIDATVFPGNSGGPVFLKPEMVSLVNTKAVGSVFLIGVVSGYKLYQEALYSHQSNPPIVSGISVENSGLATVVPLNFAKDIYDEFISTNKTLEKEVRGEDKIVDEKIEVIKK